MGNERGIEVEEHWLGPGGENSKAVFRTLRHRGITGLLLAPPGLTVDPVEIAVPPGRPFQVVTFGWRWVDACAPAGPDETGDARDAVA